MGSCMSSFLIHKESIGMSLEEEEKLPIFVRHAPENLAFT
jgi:hypothetical protein